MALPRTPAPARQRPVRASAERITPERLQGGTVGRLTAPWQERALAYYDLIGELHQAAQFYAKPLSRLTLGVAVRNAEDGSLEPIEDPGHPAVEALDRVQDPNGGRAIMLSTYGQLMFVTGECNLLSTVQEDATERWEIVSTDELKANRDGSGYQRRRQPGAAAQALRAAPPDEWDPLPDSAVVYRLWKRHPRWSAWADSPMKAVLDIAEELVMLTLAVRARARSRLAQSGILYVPNELSPPPTAEVVGDEDPEADEFLARLTEHFVTPIEDEGTAAAVVPFIVRGPARLGDGPAKDAFFHLQTHNLEETYPEANLRTEAIRRLALGLDMPPEALLGMTDANHWTAWQVEDAIWQTHVAPVAQSFCDDLTSVFLRPTLIEDGVPDAENIVVVYDAAEILTNPDRGKDAKIAYDSRVIGKKALRDAMGFEDEDEPTEEELEEMLAVALRDPSLISGLPPEGAVPELPVDENPRPPVEPEVGDEEEPPVGGPNGAASARVLGAAEYALARCRELAGSRIRSKYRSRAEMRVADGVPNATVAAALGAVTLEQMGADPVDLVSTGATTFRELLVAWGYRDKDAEALAQMIEMYAARTLFEERQPAAPAGFAGFLHRTKP